MVPQKILIIGCSVAGPTLASFLLALDIPASKKPQITILERANEVRPEGQNVDIRGAGVTIMRKLGLEKAIRAATTGEEGVRFVDAQSRIWAQFAADRSGKTSTPTADIEILRGSLAKICFQRSKEMGKQVEQAGGPGIEYIFGDQLDRIDQDGNQVTVHFEKSGETRAYDLVVAADGLQSRTRAMVFGEDDENARLSSWGMYSAFFSMPRAETDDEWRSWFHASGRRGIMKRPSEFKDRTTISIFVTNEEDERLRKLASRGHRDVDAQKALLGELFKDAGWECERVIREMWASKDFYYDMVAQIKMDKWSKGRVVLLGDAAWCASPLSGQGTTLAFSGAYNLAGALSANPDDYSAAFEQYENEMRPVVKKAQKLAPGIKYLLHPETEWGVFILNAVMGFFYWSGLISLIARFAGPRSYNVPIKEYGILDMPELNA